MRRRARFPHRFRTRISAHAPWVGSVALIIYGAIVGVACAEPAREPPDILLISVDTLRADHLGIYGDTRAVTPVIDALARSGVVFEQAQSPVPITLPAHASMLTGLLPPRHGLRDNGAWRLPDSVETLAEQLRARRYVTGAFIGAAPLDSSTGLDRGFDRFDDDMVARTVGGSSRVERPERYAEEVLSRALAWLRAVPSDRPVFAFVHLYDPHSPYEKALPGESTPGYDGEIAWVDSEIGRFREALDQVDRRWAGALTVLTSDHGEGLGEHGEQTHCVFVYQSTLHVPLILHRPGVLPSRRIAEPVSLVDLTPTILEFAGLEAKSTLDGRSLAPAALGGKLPSSTRELYFESLFGQLRFGWAPLRGIRAGDLKLIDAPRAEVFDLAADPHESVNRYDSLPEQATDLRAAILDVGEGERAVAALDEEMSHRLTSLGYVGALPEGGGMSEEDPKDRIAVYEAFQRAHAAAQLGRLDEALELMERLETDLSRSPYFYLEWGNFAALAERWSEAATAYHRCLALDAQNEDALLNLGVALLRSEDPGAAIEAFERLLTLRPDHVKALLYAGTVRYRNLRDPVGAKRHWTRFVELAPNHPDALQVRRALANLG